MKFRQVSAADDLEKLAAQINAAVWDADNDIGLYSAAGLAAYLSHDDRLILVCTVGEGDREKLAGMASAQFQLKPYSNQCWLYVDEVDTSVSCRRKGVATGLMRLLFELARKRHCVEVWLGTEKANTAAQALYDKLRPQEREVFVGYSYQVSSDASA